MRDKFDINETRPAIFVLPSCNEECDCCGDDGDDGSAPDHDDHD